MTRKFKNLAAVDLGSNSFRLIVGRVEETPTGSPQIYPTDALREPVRLAAGLTHDKFLDNASQQRALDTLRRFGELIRDYPPENVRAVATNTLRVAKNSQEFLALADAALGFPIEVIAGREEARLIYAGASRSVPSISGKRLVVDIGGGSTEFVIGKDYDPILMESLYIGCVGHSRQYFPNNNVDDYTMKQAELAARREIQSIAAEYKGVGWDQSIGSSGTARALAEILELNGLNDKSIEHGITREGLDKLKRLLIKAENVNRLKLEALKPDRVPVLAGGLSIMLSVFKELDVQHMEVTDGALRLGVLYDLLGRVEHHDMRDVTVEQFTQRYSIERAQAERIAKVALALHSQFPVADDDVAEDESQALRWAAQLHEVGLSISHNSYHKHSAYIVSNADMPGFSKKEQLRLAALVLGHTGKLGKLTSLARQVDWHLVLCLRLACLLCRRRSDNTFVGLTIAETSNGWDIGISRKWTEENPLTEFSLRQECVEWGKVEKVLNLSYF